MGGFVFMCAILGEMWDFGGLTLHFLIAWLLRKWGKSEEIGNFGLLLWYGFKKEIEISTQLCRLVLIRSFDITI